MTDVNPLFPLFPPYAELPTLEWWTRLEQHFQETPSWDTIETILLREQLDGRLGFAFGKYLDLYHRNIITKFDTSSISVTPGNHLFWNSLLVYFNKTADLNIQAKTTLLPVFSWWLHQVHKKFTAQELSWWKKRLTAPAWWWAILSGETALPSGLTADEWVHYQEMYSWSQNPASLLFLQNQEFIDIGAIMAS